ncbi:S41 family peptidase [Psychroserpens sp. Hel_I_66]|uniref:S41 family peptidase n=1 Tax=Psychroserpens sp. Hel_I_66 TaxID=1250004 RepID=UPI0006487CF0|nr:S41 family peptidase [Psychroserpens sp. Hel_I_66]
MKTTVLSTITLFLYALISAQTSHNLDFEILENDSAKGWTTFGTGDYKVSFDTSVVKNGKVSGAIESTGANTQFKALAYTIPANFGGEKIKLTGYLKTENVNGFAGLWLRIDPQIAFDNMRSRKINGTNDWKKYEIELDLDNRAQQIVFGGLLSGSGKIWIDKLEITIDGKPLEQAPKKALDKVQLDQEFDNGSNITFGNLTTQKIENLDLLGRVWGFLKYHHPEIAKGNVNWDYELFRVLPDYQNAKTIEERDAILIAWIDQLGTVELCKSCKEVSKNAFLKPNLDWMTSNSISKELSNKLQYIQKNRNQGNHYYIGMMPGVGNPEFKNENPYSEMKYPDAGFRLLFVYRYWNMINYFFPNKHLIDKDWDSCLSEYIPKFINANNELEYELAALQMIADIKDTHANLWGGNDKIQEQRGYYFAPVHVKFIESKLVVDDFFDEEKSKDTGLEIGDVITHINDKPIDLLVEEMNAFYPASNQPTRLRDISFDMLRSTKQSLQLTVKRKETTRDLSIDLFNKNEIKGYYRWYPERTESSFKKLNDDIGYVTLQNITDEDIDLLKEEFKDTKGIIVDIRNYPSTFVPFKLGNYLNSNRSYFVKFTQGSINQPGEFTHRDGHKVGRKRGWTYKGEKVIVLVNEISQSNAEYTAMAFRAGDKTTIIGSTTAGADGNVSSINLPGGLSTMISGIGVQYPDGSETQRIGIVPDIEVKPTIKGITEGRDEVLEKAIELINQNITQTETIKH